MAFICLVIASSCKREYICTCKIINDTGQEIDSKEIAFKKSNNTDAQSACENNELIEVRSMEQAKCSLK